jgi:HEPN domain-containing protein
MVNYWLKTAADDWKTSQPLFSKREYVNALFFGHLYLEKLLKAFIVQEIQAPAPYGHRLGKLAEVGNLSLSQEQLELLNRVTEYNLKTRYPDWQFEFKKTCTRKFCKSEPTEIEGFGTWLQKKIM